MNSTILLVEEEEEARVLTRAMRAEGVNASVEVISDAADAKAYCRGSGEFADRRHHPAPDLVLLDVGVSQGSGLTVLRTLRHESAFKSAIVVVLSSSWHIADVASAYASGANAFLIKPADPQALRPFVKTLTDFWLTANVPPPVM